MLATVRREDQPPKGAWLGADIWRSVDASEINALANHPDVLPFVCGDDAESADLSPFVANPFNLFFVGAFGGAGFIWRGPGIYEAFGLILPTGRGKWALSACSKMLDEIFNQGLAHMVWGEVPVANRGARYFARLLGFGSCGVVTKPRGDGQPPERLEAFVLWSNEWADRSASGNGGRPCAIS